ncbi:Rho termination factor N-terminal domain-containing protein [Halalkalibacter oceani]
MNNKKLSNMTMKELYELAKEKGIAGRSKMNKVQLLKR